MSVVLPELELRYFLLRAIEEIKADKDKFADLIFGSLQPIGNFDIKREFKSLFAKENPYNIKIGIAINTSLFPAVHIYLPQEEEDIKGLGMSPTFSYEPGPDDEEGEPTLGVVVEDDEIYFNSRYSLMIVDVNADTVLLLYHVLKFMFYRYAQMLDTSGFHNVKISGNDLVTEQNVVPNAFARNLNISFSYVFSTRNAITQAVGKELLVDEDIDMQKP